MYEELARVMLETADHLRPAFASHNVRSLAAAIEAARELGLPDGAFEIQMLHGMGDPIKQAVRGMGLRLREYVPVGELIPGMAYLVRRLLENTANDSFLRQTFVEGARRGRAGAAAGAVGRLRAGRCGCDVPHPRTREARGRSQHAAADFSRRENARASTRRWRGVRAELGAHYPCASAGAPWSRRARSRP